MGEIFRLNNQIQNYAWGSRTVLAKMRGLNSPSIKPEAELWVGAHPAASSVVELSGRQVSLADMVAADPDRVLPVRRSSDCFPFLLKILAIDAPLSIQVHPSSELAAAGFAAEESAGIGLDDPARNYPDRFSKPETVIALEPMKILSGVRPPAELAELADGLNLPWLRELLPGQDSQELLTSIIRMPERQAAAATRLTVAQAAAARTDPELPSGLAEACDLISLIDKKHPGDRGLLVATVMNLVHLEPGDSAFTPDGQVHAYVSGSAVEIMNPSDNVLRAGLTPKHIDTEELIRALRVDQTAPQIQRPQTHDDRAAVFFTWDKRLTLTRVRLEDDCLNLRLKGTATALGVRGRLTFEGVGQRFDILPTEALLHLGDSTDVVVSGRGEAYIAAYI